MSYSDPRHRHGQRLTQWLAAIRQHAAWLYAADEQYVYLMGEANDHGMLLQSPRNSITLTRMNSYRI
ncbi:hypothetical protein DZ894_06485 [Pseudomonas aeruginosa]|nr:hypothetical protein DZ894_06485 [Pseudomonas aeruginosa]